MKAKLVVFVVALAAAATVYAGNTSCAVEALCCGGNPPCC
jgi:hypothetical protein